MISGEASTVSSAYLVSQSISPNHNSQPLFLNRVFLLLWNILSGYFMSSNIVLNKEGPMTEPEYPDATQGPFSFDSSGFYIRDASRESGPRLRRLLFPESLKNKKAKKSAQDDASIIDRPWIKAQLQYYGIHFSPDIDPFKAKALLLTSVAHGLVSLPCW